MKLKLTQKCVNLKIFLYGIFFVLILPLNTSGQSYLKVYCDEVNNMTEDIPYNGTLWQSFGQAYEGVKDYEFNISMDASSGAMCGFNFDNNGAQPPLNLTNYHTFEFSYSGPANYSGTKFWLTDGDSDPSAQLNLSSSNQYTTIQIPFTNSAATDFDFNKVVGITFVFPGSGVPVTSTLRLDDIKFVSLSPAPEIGLNVGTKMLLTKDSHDFGTIEVNSSSNSLQFVIENKGNSNLVLNGAPKISISGIHANMFTINEATTSGTIAPSNNTTFFVTYTPTTTGFHNARLTIQSNDPDEEAFVIRISGNGNTNPTPTMEIMQNNNWIVNNGNFDFGDVNVGTSGLPVTFTIRNGGMADLDITDISIAGPGSAMFSIDESTTATTIPSFATTTFEITFSPTTAGDQSATLYIQSNDPDGVFYAVELTGTGNIISGTTDKLSESSYSIYPNPVNNVLKVTLDKVSDNSIIIIRNMLGESIREIKAESREIEIVLTEEPPGIYLVEIVSNESVALKKIIKQ